MGGGNASDIKNHTSKDTNQTSLAFTVFIDGSLFLYICSCNWSCKPKRLQPLELSSYIRKAHGTNLCILHSCHWQDVDSDLVQNATNKHCGYIVHA